MPPSFDFRSVDRLPAQPAGSGALRRAPLHDASGAPLLFIPGGYHGAWCYAHWLARCAEANIDAGALDYRGHGALATKGLALDASIHDYATDTLAAARLFATPPILVGHSLGGLVAMVAAMQTPLAGLVLVAPSPPGNLPGAHAIAPVDPTRLRPPPARAEVVERFLGGADGTHVDAVLNLLCPESPQALNERYRLAIAIEASRIRVPVLVIEAGLDCGERHPAGQDQGIADFLCGEFRHLASAAHCMMMGAKSDVAFDLIANWRRRLGLAGKAES
jgi:pimeloyl-ACP methyl ester carboxylesterase